MKDMNNLIITSAVTRIRALTVSAPKSADETAWNDFYRFWESELEQVRTLISIICESIGADMGTVSYAEGNILFRFDMTVYFRSDRVPIENLEEYVLSR